MIEQVSEVLSREFKRLNWLGLGLLVAGVLLLGIGLYLVYALQLGMSLVTWLPALLIATAIFLIITSIALYTLYRMRFRLEKAVTKEVGGELLRLRSASERAESLKQMASTLSASLSFELVVEQALDACSLALADMGIPRHTLVGAVFLYNSKSRELVPIAKRRFLGSDSGRVLLGQDGVVAEALDMAEPMVTDNPGQDPELSEFAAFQDCLTAVCIPLRAGFQLFGVMVLGTHTAVTFNESHFDLFNAVADQSVIALQNAQLYQHLEAEKLRLIEADEEARRELARDLHDGPTQTIAAIAMRLSYIRTLVKRDPDASVEEILKVEELAKKTSKEVRGMLFTLRPLVLETQGLGAAVRTVMERIQETDGIEMNLIGGENGRLLDTAAQGVAFSIIEEALSNARKHAKAEAVEVRMWKEDGLFVTRISDNGKGFDIDAINRDYSSRGSLGMVNMRERAERIDGSVRIESTPGRGTTVTLVVPLEQRGALGSGSDDSPQRALQATSSLDT